MNLACEEAQRIALIRSIFFQTKGIAVTNRTQKHEFDTTKSS